MEDLAIETSRPRTLTGRKIRGEFAFFAVLLAALLLFFGRTFHNPPRSDYWSAFYVFAQVGAEPDAPDWTSILTFDLWQHGTYRPLSHLLLFIQYRIFRDWFTGHYLTNFAMYFLGIFLMFRLADVFGIRRVTAGAFLTVYAFLFSHFDIVTWPFQIFSTSSFAAALLAYLTYIRFLKNRRPGAAAATGILFIYALLCSEVYAAWPLALLLLTAASERLFGTGSERAGKPWWACGGIIFYVYIVYAAGFALSRTAAETTGEVPIPGLDRVVLAGAGVFFNLIYNGIAGNLVPMINTPINMYYNIELGGLLLRWALNLPTIVYVTGSAGVVLLAAAGIAIYRKGDRRLLLTLSFFLFLYLTYFFTTTAGRLSTNHISYTLIQFRYQFVPNALVVLMAAAAVDRLLRPVKREMVILGCGLAAVLFANAYLVNNYILIINRSLQPLRQMLDNISRGLETGAINPGERLYIEDNVVRHLPQLSWNRDMARFMRGTYQWFFPPDKLDAFTFNRDQAAWIIRAHDPGNIHRVGKTERQP